MLHKEVDKAESRVNIGEGMFSMVIILTLSSKQTIFTPLRHGRLQFNTALVPLLQVFSFILAFPRAIIF